MIVWVVGDVIGAKGNQRAELLEIVAGNLRLRICGTNEIALISPDETCGVEFSDSVAIAFQPTGICRHRNFSESNR